MGRITSPKEYRLADVHCKYCAKASFSIRIEKGENIRKIKCRYCGVNALEIIRQRYIKD